MRELNGTIIGVSPVGLTPFSIMHAFSGFVTTIFNDVEKDSTINIFHTILLAPALRADFFIIELS